MAPWSRPPALWWSWCQSPPAWISSNRWAFQIPLSVSILFSGCRSMTWPIQLRAWEFAEIQLLIAKAARVSKLLICGGRNAWGGRPAPVRVLHRWGTQKQSLFWALWPIKCWWNNHNQSQIVSCSFPLIFIIDQIFRVSMGVSVKQFLCDWPFGQKVPVCHCVFRTFFSMLFSSSESSVESQKGTLGRGSARRRVRTRPCVWGPHACRGWAQVGAGGHREGFPERLRVRRSSSQCRLLAVPPW